MQTDGGGPAHLFVYGTLRREADTKWSRFLGSVSRFAGNARARGRLFQVKDYPGMVASIQDDEWVVGEVYLMNEPSTLLLTLDDYEECGPNNPTPHEYVRQVIEVVLDDGAKLPAWAYLYQMSTADKVRIWTGDYLRYGK